MILGNLLDNAISALDIVDKDKKFYVGIRYTKNKLLIKIQNSFNKEWHRYELKNIAYILEKYNE